ncbi:hypothetical protein ACV07N_11340 [Roseivirga echinicomitans]
MTKSKEIRGKILRYAEGKLQESQDKSDRIIKYVHDVSTVGQELFYSNVLLAGHKYIKVEVEGKA